MYITQSISQFQRRSPVFSHQTFGSISYHLTPSHSNLTYSVPMPTLSLEWGRGRWHQSLVKDAWDSRLQPEGTSPLARAAIHPARGQVPSSEAHIQRLAEARPGPLQFSSVAQSCLTLCNPTDCSTPGLPVHHQFPEFTQTHVLWVSDAIQPSHPLSSPSPPAFNLFQHQGLFKWVSSSHEVAKVLEFQL